MIQTKHIPDALKKRPQWVLWRNVVRKGLATKVPFSVNGKPAKANDPATWASFEDVLAAHQRGGYDGIGYEFAADDPFCGIDLDGCRDPETNQIADWARTLIKAFDSYAEVSPSETGVKIFIVGKSPLDKGRKVEFKDEERICEKMPAVEVYDHVRYFAVTGMKLATLPAEPQPRQAQLDALCKNAFPPQETPAAFHAPDAVVDRARNYLAKCPPAITNQGGHNAAFRVACVLMLGFQLERSAALTVIREWNQTCQPPWSEKELVHKIDSAAKQPGERGYLRNAKPQQWSSVSVPEYQDPAAREPKKFTTLADAALEYIGKIRDGKTTLIETRMPELDSAIGGGVEPGEMVVIAARPSHGKSTVALQCAHNLSGAGYPVLIITEEMSAMALGKRTLQFASGIPQESWWKELADVELDLRSFAGDRSDCYIIENCGTTEVVVSEIERFVREKQIKVAIVDYCQLLSSPGKDRYEKVTNTSIALRRVASEQKIVLLVLAQLNREIESRPKFEPKMSDLKETGQLEQDADVVIFLVWPHRIDHTRDPHNYKFYVAKNRNREIAKPVFDCRFEPSRQMLVKQTARDLPNYEPRFEEHYQP